MTFFNLTFFTQLITSAAGSCAFALVFKTHRRHLALIGFSGLVTYFVYYAVGFFGGGFFVSSFAATVFAAMLGEFFARACRAPAMIYLLTALIPIVPGGEAYYTMRYLLEQTMQKATEKLLSTGAVALGIASGIVFVSLLVGVISDRCARTRKGENHGRD